MNGKNLIKVVDLDVANKLVALGFSYIKEQINNQDVFVFTSDVNILKHLQNNFDKTT